MPTARDSGDETSQGTHHSIGKDAAPEAASSSRGRFRRGVLGLRAEEGRVVGFRQRVTLSFAAVAVSTTLLFVVVLTLVWNNQFASYTRTTMENLAESTAAALARVYNTRSYWSTSQIDAAAAGPASTDGVGIQGLNADGVVLYDSTRITDDRSVIFDDEISLAPEESHMVVAPVVSETGKEVGVVRVWAYGSDLLLTQRDKSFRDSSFEAIALAAVASVVLAVLMGLVFSRALTRPVRAISQAAQRIKEGDLTARSGLSGDDDLGQLGETFDDMAESLERDRELERRLTSDVAHELRTPLMSILATVEAMQDEVLPCDQEHLALVSSETKRLSRLVDSMLRLSRLENGSVRLDIIPVDVVALVRGIATSHQALLEDMGLEMAFENLTGRDELDVELDRDTVTQAVTNIISNAMRYTPAPGKVTVRVAADEDGALVSVSDTGIGIAPEDLDRVFGRFWRAEESRNRVAGGLGVGLAVTKEIVDRHHGMINVESEQGVGTTFTIFLPFEQPGHGDHGAEGHGGHRR